MRTDTTHRLPYSLRPDFKVGRASDLAGADRRLYRALEIAPALVSWGTLIAVVAASIYAPVFAAYFIIAFSLYWLLKTLFLSMHLRHNWRRLRHNLSVNWRGMLEPLKHEHLRHLVVLPFYKEPEEVVEAARRRAERDQAADLLALNIGCTWLLCCGVVAAPAAACFAACAAGCEAAEGCGLLAAALAAA